jgi:hypothetical protein
MASVDGLTLEFSNNRTVPDSLDAINDQAFCASERTLTYTEDQ